MLDLLAALERFYGPLPTPPTDPFRVYVWEALSTQTAPGRRDAAYAALQRIPALTPDALVRASRATLTSAVAHAGSYAEQRIQALMAAADRFRRTPGLAGAIRGSIRTARRAAATLPRAGEGSVHRLLLFGGQHCVLPLDRDVLRVGRRLGFGSTPTGPGTPRRVRRAMEDGLPAFHETFARAAVYLRHHALHTCTDEPHCGVCPVAGRCPWRTTRG